MKKITWLAPVFEGYSVNVDEILCIVRYKRITTCTGMGSDHFVSVLILFVPVFLSEFSEDRTVMGCGMPIEIQNRDASQNAIHCCPALLRPAAVAVCPRIIRLRVK